MIIVILIVFILLTILGMWMQGGTYYEDSGIVVSILCGLGAVVSFIVLLILCIEVSGLLVIDKKIEMYQAENTNIEAQISQCVENYQKYENDVFAEVKSNDVITLVTLYPELKSDTLVAKQIDVYISNNEKIKELKEQKINGKVTRWWLYFGGENQ